MFLTSSPHATRLEKIFLPLPMVLSSCAGYWLRAFSLPVSPFRYSQSYAPPHTVRIESPVFFCVPSHVRISVFSGFLVTVLFRSRLIGRTPSPAYSQNFCSKRADCARFSLMSTDTFSLSSLIRCSLIWFLSNFLRLASKYEIPRTRFRPNAHSSTSISS